MKWNVSDLKRWLTVTGLVFVACGLGLQFADQIGLLRYEEREAFLKWALESQEGLPIEEPAGKAFRARFPPPPDSHPADITHVTKHVVRFERGPVSQASFSYMHRDPSRTSHVATLADVRAWATESRYGWWSLAVALFWVSVNLYTVLY
jgi:hypothetical protein